MSDEEEESLRNSEYVDLAAGAFPAYGNDGTRSGYLPQGRLAVGKYWMPVLGWHGGLDVNIALVQYFRGHPPGLGQNEIFTVAAAFFYRL